MNSSLSSELLIGVIQEKARSKKNEIVTTSVV